MNPNTETPPVITNAFSTQLAGLREGQTLIDLDEALAALLSRVRQTFKPGTMVFTLKVTPASRGAGNALMFTGKVATKLPEFETESTIFFVDDDLSLHREDPRQKRLDLREVPKPVLPLREVAPNTAPPLANAVNQ